MFDKLKSRNYKIIIVKKLDETHYRKIDEKKIKLTDEILSYKDKTIPLKDASIFDDGNKTVAFWDYDNNAFIQLHNKPLRINAKFLDNFLTTSKFGIIGQLITAIREGMKEKKTDWGAMGKPIVIFILGAVIGYFVGGGSI